MRGSRCSVGLFWLLLAAGPVASADDEAEFFTQHVEPLLRKRCYACHSHAADEMEGGLTLDWRSGWETGGTRGPAVVPGDPAASLLIRAIRHMDPELRMPEEPLPEQEVAVLTRWVERGAADPRTTRPESFLTENAGDWWSLRPLVRPPVPNTGAANPIDAFIQSRLQTETLHPSPEADPRTLIRRLTVNLHGLPPTIEETEAFVADSQPEAYDRLVERLLDSPRYGERWARHWFDTIHFADSHGFEHDVFRPNAWRFRDYVIDSFQRDTPWPQFIREQLAADVFYPNAPQLTVALGYLGAGTYDHSAAITAPMSFEHLDRDDLVTQTMGAFVSTTANCARCHAHKFDPIPQADYYALQAVFAGIGKGDVAYDADLETAALRRRWQLLKTAADERRSDVLLAAENRKLVTAWEESRGADAVWQPLDLEVFVSSDGAVLQRQADGSLLSTGTRPDKDAVTVTASSPMTRITAVRLDVLTDPSLPLQGPGRTDNGNLHLSEFEVQAFRPGAGAGEVVRIRQATADFDQAGWTIAHAIDGDLKTAWGIHPAVGVPHHAVFELETPLEYTEGTRLAVTLKQLHGAGHVIGRFRLSVLDGPPLTAIALPTEAHAALELPPDQRSGEQQTALAAAILRQRADLELRQLPAQIKVYAAAARAENERGVVVIETPREIHLLKRGNLDQSGSRRRAGSAVRGGGTVGALRVTAASRGIRPPRRVGRLAGRSAESADLAEHRESPVALSLRPRAVSIHRMTSAAWASLPSHPELLDWLACEIPRRRRVAQARAPARSSPVRRIGRHRPGRTNWRPHDPDNRLLWPG